MTAGKPEKALCILQRIAKENNKELPPGELVATEKQEVCYEGDMHVPLLSPQPALTIFTRLTRFTPVNLFLADIPRKNKRSFFS